MTKVATGTRVIRARFRVIAWRNAVQETCQLRARQNRPIGRERALRRRNDLAPRTAMGQIGQDFQSLFEDVM